MPPVHLGEGDHITYDVTRNRWRYRIRLTGGRERTGLADSESDALEEFRAWAWQRPEENRDPPKKR